MCMSGATIGMTHIALLLRAILLAQVRDNIVCCAVVVGTSVRLAAVFLFAATTLRQTATTISAFVWFVFLSFEELSDFNNGVCQMRVQRK